MNRWERAPRNSTQPDTPQEVYFYIATPDATLLAKPLYCEAEFLPYEQPAATEELATLQSEANRLRAIGENREGYWKDELAVRLDPQAWDRRMRNYFATLKNIRQLDRRLDHDRDFTNSELYLKPSEHELWMPANWLEKRRLRALGRSIGRICAKLQS